VRWARARRSIRLASYREATGSACCFGKGSTVAADFSATRRALAQRLGADTQRLGADVVIDPGAESPYQRWRDLAAVDDPSRAVDPMAAMLGMPLLRRAAIFECVVVRGMLSPVEFGMTLYNIARGRIDVGPLITDEIPIDGVPNAFLELKSPDRHAKIVVVPA
jgi:threonine dehydrogenase-like Zn-dependent dehydrogenase